MYISFEPEEFEERCETRVCDFHKDNPGVEFIDCTCIGGWFYVRSVKEIVAINDNLEGYEE